MYPSNNAKRVQITTYLSISTDKIEVWIKSPFNPSERTPSFKINTQKNVWYDFAMGRGGSIIDLVMILNNCTFNKAIKMILNLKDITVKKLSKITTNTELSKITKIKYLSNLALVKYLQKRNINISLAKRYIKEVYFTNNSKRYFALAFKNNSSNYEIRNEFFKGCIGSKDITTIQGIDNTKISIFEGFMDFLSALTFFDMVRFNGTVIILNSLSLLNRVVPLLKDKKIYLFLDNDTAGKRALELLRDSNLDLVNCSKYYKDYKDFNDLLMNES